MSVVASIIFYNIVFAIALYFIKKGNKTLSFERFGMLILILLAIFRFDMGADYENYYRSIRVIAENFNAYGIDMRSIIALNASRYEYSFLLIIWLFHKLENPQIYVFAVYFIITIYFWYKTLKSNNDLYWGMYTIIVFSILFTALNQIRQGVSYAIFLYSIQFLFTEKRNIKKYILYILLASFFHTSALLLLLLPFFKFRRVYIKAYISIIVFTYIVSMLGLWDSLQNLIFKSSFINMFYSVDDKLIAAGAGGGKLTLTIYVIVYTFLLHRIKKNTLLANLLFVGIVLLCIASNDLSIKRISYYFLNVVVLALPYFIKQENNCSVVRTYIMATFLIFQINLLRGDVKDGCIPYDYIWSENGEKETFRIRSYRDN